MRTLCILRLNSLTNVSTPQLSQCSVHLNCSKVQQFMTSTTRSKSLSSTRTNLPSTFSFETSQQRYELCKCCELPSFFPDVSSRISVGKNLNRNYCQTSHLWLRNRSKLHTSDSELVKTFPLFSSEVDSKERKGKFNDKLSGLTQAF